MYSFNPGADCSAAAMFTKEEYDTVANHEKPLTSYNNKTQVIIIVIMNQNKGNCGELAGWTIIQIKGKSQRNKRIWSTLLVTWRICACAHPPLCQTDGDGWREFGETNLYSLDMIALRPKWSLSKVCECLHSGNSHEWKCQREESEGMEGEEARTAEWKLGRYVCDSCWLPHIC